MQLRMLLAVATGLALVGAPSLRASAQNEAPFTIRYPPDGATVREKVRIRIPLASIPEGGYVSLYIDGDFRGALSVTPEERDEIQKAALKKKEPAYFEYVWDTKAPVKKKFSNIETRPADGQHTIMAKLFQPGKTETAGSTLIETSSVNIIVANKFDPGNIGPIKLQYKFVDGTTSNYDRNGLSAVVAGLSQGMQGSGDQELVSYKSDLVVGVEDKYSNGHAIVRNKMKRLEVRQGSNVSFYPSEQLPNSLYQELDPLGNVVYQNSNATFDQFAQLGVPVSATLELPILPRQSVSVGDVWQSDGKVEIPGTAPDKQPKVQMQSKFEGFEWEGGHPTAHIHQSYDSSKQPGLNAKEPIMFGTVLVTQPTVKYDQDIFVAYRSGKLIKVVRKVEVVGKTTEQIGGAPGAGAPGMGGPPMMGGGGPGFSGGGGASPYGGGGPPGGGYANMMRGRPGPGMGGGGASPYGGGGPPGGGYTSQMRGRGGGPGGKGGGSPFSGGGAQGPMTPPAAPGGGFRGGGFAGGTGRGETGQQITLKSTTTTELSQTQTASR